MIYDAPQNPFLPIALFFVGKNWPKNFSPPRTPQKKSPIKKKVFSLTGGGRIRDVASLIRRTDEPKIKKFFWGKKSK